jgi:hypothetical protein
MDRPEHHAAMRLDSEEGQEHAHKLKLLRVTVVRKGMWHRLMEQHATCLVGEREEAVDVVWDILSWFTGRRLFWWDNPS